jgi:DNA-binding MarR family transcriptional regulator
MSHKPEPARVLQKDYERLADFRYALRRFLEFSQSAAKAAGLTPQQHQALLAIKGHRGTLGMTVGELAARLIVRHHSAVELIDRLVEAGLIVRQVDPEDGRRARLVLTGTAEALLESLSASHLEELRRAGPELERLLTAVRFEENA